MINNCQVGFVAALRNRGKIICAINLRILLMFCFDLWSLKQGIAHNTLSKI
jgi:hypothetical protein